MIFMDYLSSWHGGQFVSNRKVSSKKKSKNDEKVSKKDIVSGRKEMTLTKKSSKPKLKPSTNKLHAGSQIAVRDK